MPQMGRPSALPPVRNFLCILRDWIIKEVHLMLMSHCQDLTGPGHYAFEPWFVQLGTLCIVSYRSVDQCLL